MRIDYSLKDALTWRFVAVAILPLLIISLVSFDFFARITEEQLKHQNLASAKSIAAQISLEIRTPYILIREIAELLPHATLDTAEYDRILDRVVSDNTIFKSLFLLNDAGQTLVASVPGRISKRNELLRMDLSQLPVLQQARSKNGVIWSNVFWLEPSDEPALAMACRSGSNYLVGFFDLDNLRRQLAFFEDEHSQLQLLDQQGTMVLEPADQASFTSLAGLPPVAAILHGASETANYELKGRSYIGTAVQLSDSGWHLLFGQNRNILTGAIWRLRIIYALGCLLAIFFASLLARQLAKKITRPISELVESTGAFCRGDYNLSLPYGNHREIDELSDSFRQLRTAIDEREQQLWRHREYFSRLFNGITDAIFISARLPNGKPGKFVEVNRVACRMLGFSREELLEMSPYDLNRISQEDPEGFDLILQDLGGTGRTLFKTELATKDNGWVPVEIGSQLFELDGRRVFFSVARDITLREKYEASIKTLVRSTVGLTGQDCLDEITRNLCSWLHADGAIVCLFRDQRIETQACCLDGEQVELESIPFAETPYHGIHAGQYQFFAEQVDQLFPSYAPCENYRTNSFIGIPMFGHDGQVIGAVSVFSREAMRPVPHVQELLSVIASRAAAESERMRYECELSYSEEMLRTLLNSTAEAIVGIDLQGEVIFCNPASLQILGYTSEAELIGQRFHELVSYHPDNAEGTLENCPFIASTRQDNKTAPTDETLRHRNGQSIPVEFWSHSMYRGDELVGAVVTFIDISRRRILEKQLRHSQRMEAIGTLTGGIAHDFNNILTVISGYVGLLQAQCQGDQDLLKKINKIAEASERGSKLTHGLLAYGRKKTGPSTPVDLNQLVLSVQDLFGKVIGERIEKQITLDDQQLVVLGDTSQLEQVLVNLATNARDAMPDGGVLTMKTSFTSIDQEFCRMHGYGEPGEYALITVEDTGVGMAKDVQQKIFDPFYTTKDTGKGTGLGLAIAWGIVKQHKGYILVDSDPGQGTRFRIYLPLTQKKMIEQVAAQAGSLPGGDETLLLVEDDQQVRESTYSILRAVGYQVLTSDCADSALKLLDDRGPEVELILSDVVMPGMKGTEFYAEIRRKTAVPVIFISGYTFDSLREQGLVGDDIMLLNKPIPPIDLLTKIRETLDREQATKSA